MITEITQSSEFDSLLKESTLPILVDFWAPWCGPCRALTPVVHTIAEEFNGRANVCKVNLDSNQTLAQRYNVSAIPTIIVFQNGEPMTRITGLTTVENLRNVLSPLVG